MTSVTSWTLKKDVTPTGVNLFNRNSNPNMNASVWKAYFLPGETLIVLNETARIALGGRWVDAIHVPLGNVALRLGELERNGERLVDFEPSDLELSEPPA